MVKCDFSYSAVPWGKALAPGVTFYGATFSETKIRLFLVVFFFLDLKTVCKVQENIKSMSRLVTN